MKEAADYSAYPLIFSGKFIRIYDVSASLPQVALAVWNGFIEPNDEACHTEVMETIHHVGRIGAKVYISDCLGLEVANADFLAWCEKVFYPELYKKGLRVEVLIESQDHMGQMALDMIAENSGAVKTLFVTSFDEAKVQAQAVLERLHAAEAA